MKVFIKQRIATAAGKLVCFLMTNTENHIVQDEHQAGYFLNNFQIERK